MSEHIITGIVERFGTDKESYQDVTNDDFMKDSNVTLRGILHSMLGKRVIITISEYKTPGGIFPE